MYKLLSNFVLSKWLFPKLVTHGRKKDIMWLFKDIIKNSLLLADDKPEHFLIRVVISVKNKVQYN